MTSGPRSAEEGRVAVQAPSSPRVGRFVEPWPRPVLRPGRVLRDVGRTEVANGLMGSVFSMTGPVAVILAAAELARLTSAETSSWIFGAFFLNGLLTIVASWLYQRPLAFLWTIPGSVVVGQAAIDLAWTDILGSYLITAAVVLLVGLLVPMDRFMAVLPMPVVMAMVAGVFLPFGVQMVDAVADDWWIGAPMVAAFVLATLTSGVRSWLPPILAASAVGVIAVLVAGDRRPGAAVHGVLATPVVQAPTFSWAATTELVVPLAVTVLLVQNAQGMAVLSAAGHRAPMRFTTLASGLWSVPSAAVGAVSTCLAGPTNALLTSSGRRERQYAAGLVCGFIALAFGLAAPAVVGGCCRCPAPSSPCSPASPCSRPCRGPSRQRSRPPRRWRSPRRWSRSWSPSPASTSPTSAPPSGGWSPASSPGA